MHFCIPSTQELYSDLTGTSYTAFNIYINGAFHCCLRYKQLHALHEELRRRVIELSDNTILSLFPPKRILPLTKSQIDARRMALEHYLQTISQDGHIAKSETFQTFLLNAQVETAVGKGDLKKYGGGGGYATMDVLLMNNYSVPVTGRVYDSTSALLNKIAQCLNLSDQMVPYFCLFLAKLTKNKSLLLLRLLMDFESPFISRMHSADPQCQILLRTSHWNRVNDLPLLNNDVALNLLYLQTVADIEREWIVSTLLSRKKLRALQIHGLKKEYLELARELPLYVCLQFQATNVDFPDTQSFLNEVGNGKLNTYLISIGNKELSVRTVSGAKIYETKFRVTRMRCWRVTAVHRSDDATDARRYEPPGQLSFEYLMSKHVLRWITITSSQAMLMSVCLQAMVDELVAEQKKEKCDKEKNYQPCPRLATSLSMPSMGNNNIERQLDIATSSTSSSPTSPIQFVSFKRSLKNNPKVFASSYAAVFFRKNSTQTESTMQNDAFEGVGEDL